MMRALLRRLPRVRLWVQLALFAAIGVVVMHTAHLAIGDRIAAGGLLKEHAQLGATIARIVAEQATDPLLDDDAVALDTLVSAASRGGQGVAYCFILRQGRVVASSFATGTPSALVSARAPGDHAPVVVRSGAARVLDISAPVIGGETDAVGEVRVGLDLGILGETRHDLTVWLGLLALAIIGLGLVAAFVVGQGIARPIREILVAADQFDPAAAEGPAVYPGGSVEIALLGERFNQMTRRLRTAQREQERARQKSAETERMVALGSLLAGVAHEVNNPLAGLKNCVHRVERTDLSEAKKEEYLHLMREGLARIEDVVKRLLDFARPAPLALIRVSTRALAEQATELVAPLLHERRITLRLLEPEHDGLVRVDSHQIGQALVNVLLNASYVSSAGGEVRVRLCRREGSLGMAIEDDGPGIPAEIRDRVLDPFFSTKPPGEGTGLGLAVTRTIVDAHGGELSFEFPEAGGTVVTLWLNAAE